MRLVLFVLVFLFLFPYIAFAAGIIVIPDIRDLGIDRAYLSVKEYRAHIDIKESVARVIVDETFVNPYDVNIEGTFLFPLPEGGIVSDFTATLNGKEVKGEIYEKDKARRIYENIVQKLVDPALLEYLGRNTYSISIAPILPHKEVKVHLEFLYTLSRIGNTYYADIPLSGLKYSKDPVNTIVVTGTIKTQKPITNIYSPFYLIDSKITNKDASFSMEKTNDRPDKDFIVYFTQDIKDVSGAFLSYVEKGEKDGYFMLMFSAMQREKAISIPKDIVVVFDHSGSMEGEKIKQAKEALNFIIDRLKPKDRISIVFFSSSVRTSIPEWIRGDSKELDSLRREIDDINAGGGTNIYDALSKALSFSKRKNSPLYIIFLTDGMPTVGIIDEEKIEQLVKRKIGKKRLFVFGIGDDVNLEFLTRLFRNGRGQGEFILGKDIKTSISSFYSKIEDPMLTNISITYPEIFYDMYPEVPRDLFWGQSITIFGRYKPLKDKVTITLKGKSVNGENLYTYEYSIIPDKTNNFIPYLWASRKIGYLLEEIRLNGESKELVDEIISLSKKYGIVTPYTSYLVKDEEEEEIYPHGISYMRAPVAVKRKGVKYEQNLQAMEMVEEVTEFPDIKIVLGKVFKKEGDYWVEEGYKKGTSVKTVKMFSPKYFDLLSKDDTLKEIFTLGKVIFNYKGEWIKIVE